MQELSLIKIGMFFVVLGVGIIILGSFFDQDLFRKNIQGKKNSSQESIEKEPEVKVSFFGFLGFIPFGLSDDKRLFFITMIMGIIFVLTMFLMFYVNNTN